MELNANSFDSMVETTQEIEVAPEYVATETKAETTETKPEVVAETKTEVVEETKPEAKTEVKVEEKVENKQPSLFDKFTKPTEEAVEVKPTEVPKEIQEELELAKAELLRYKESPIAKLLAGDYDLTKIDLKEFLSNAVGENYNSLSDEQLIEKSLSANPNFSKLSAEDQAEEIENMKAEFEGMSKLKKIEAREGLISKLSTNPTDLFKTLEEIQANQKTLADPDKFFEEKSQENFQKTFEDVSTKINGLAESLVGQEYNGYKVSADDAKAISEAFQDQTLNFDPEKVAFNLFKSATYDKAVKDAYERGKLEGVKEKSNPSTGDIKGTPIFKEDQKGIKAGMSFEEFPTL